MRLFATLTLLVVPMTLIAEEKKEPTKEAGPLELKVILKTDTIVWDADEKARKEFKTTLEDAQKKMLKKPPENVKLPALPVFEATLQITNTSKKEVTMQVEGDANKLTLDLKGPGVIALSPLRAFTANFNLGRAVTLKSGEKFEIPIQKLGDGFRRASRDIYWTDLGEYTLTASYIIGGGDGEKESVLTSEPVKFKVSDKK